ncbi:MAG: FmdB family zinc ribbon protein [Bdellovibrionota bacterium]
MPIYEFKCQACSHIDEVLMKISDPAPEKCSICSGSVQKIMSRSSFSLKGTGWYATDYKDSGSKSAAETKESEPAAETSSPATTAKTEPPAPSSKNP